MRICDKNIMFRYYVYGYLNKKYIVINRLGNQEKYRKAKIKDTMNYLNMDKYSHLLQTLTVFLISSFEYPLSIAIITFNFLYYCLIWLTSNHLESSQIHDKIIFFERQPQLKILLKKSKLENKEIVIVLFPREKHTEHFKEFENIRLLSGVSFTDIVKAFFYSVIFSSFFYFKYRKNDILFRVYSCFDYFLSLMFIEKADSSNRVLCMMTYSRWAFLMSDTKHKKIFVQHGMIADDVCFLKKVGNPDKAFFINEEQMDNCRRALFSEVGETYIMDGLHFTSNEKLLKNGKKNLLLICNQIGFEKEELIARLVVAKDSYNLYVKPHPQSSVDKYVKLSSELGFTLLNREDFPHVDIALSQISTLAIEYAEAGVEVIRYDKLKMEDLKDIL